MQLQLMSYRLAMALMSGTTQVVGVPPGMPKARPKPVISVEICANGWYWQAAPR